MANGSLITVQSEDVGTVIKGTAYTRTDGVDAVIDINDLTSITIALRDPDGTVTTYTATAVNVDGGTDGIWSFTTSSAIFTLNPGIWKIQALYSYTAGNILYSQIKTFSVGEVLA
jgi:hypothetical protein